MTDTRPPYTLGILIFPGFPMACLTSCIEPLRAANEISGTEAFRWAVIAENEGPVESSAGVTFSPDSQLSDAIGLDLLLFTAGPNARFAQLPRANAALHRIQRSKTRLGSISGGVFALARTGLTGDNPLSVHWCYEAAFQAEFSDIPIQSTVICEDGAFTTISGASAAFDHMLTLIEERLGGDIMAEVACWFQHPYVRSAAAAQTTPAYATAKSQDLLPKPVAKAIAQFAEHIESPIQISEVADAIGVSTRSLERSFKEATGQSPLKYYRKMRMDQARQLVLYTNTPVTEVAFMVGYATPGAFLRHYRETFGLTPISDRRAKNSMRVKSSDALPS
ncbi:helix-turn-helix domain-containing protein [Aliiroseovarius sp. KMU-50]|uniref:Helix-turn-helix domain-containing protein n=1 Tax=Aliiroseovarius salicola TaxID=3009082 RepID=A0ABT4W3H1_9RHOB|nr:helix-turn-helix domain-containing protein [Aliiroseovarius sp. KMU-50]MDA5094525.1 helix-turn-helix domain-containing protein [Aliiroseovarius sp. KMU-50]